MSLRLWRFWGAFLLLPFLSCRSEKPAFVFQSTSTSTEVKTIASVSVSADSLPSITEDAHTARAVELLGASSLSSSSGSKPAGIESVIHKQISQVSPVAFQPKNDASAALAHQATASRDRFHLLLGIGLIVGGVVAGLLIGGWLGLGVGALIVLLGDYFLILGLGGKHAWLEIFQEFFNL
jgi:hypothetical protein